MFRKKLDDQKLFMMSLFILPADGDLIRQYKLYRWSTLFISKNDNRVKNRLLIWKIKNAGDLQNTIDWFIDTGVRKDFSRTKEFLKAFSLERRKTYINSLSKNDMNSSRYKIADYYIDRLPASTVLAYDYSWCCYLYYVGMAYKYIKEDYGWYAIRKISKIIQSSYTGWEDYITGYIAGEQFLNFDASFSFLKRNSIFFDRMFLDSKSPANTIDWNIKLEN